jgi:hypothetical protein
MTRAKICACGHAMSRHNSAGCWQPGCNCNRKGSSKKKKRGAWW